MTICGLSTTQHEHHQRQVSSTTHLRALQSSQWNAMVYQTGPKGGILPHLNQGRR